MDEDWSSVRGADGSFDRVVVIDEIGSTQDEARRLAGGRPGQVVIAKRQVGGRGRQGRAWSDAGGASLSMSMTVESTMPAAGLSLAVGFGVVEACERLGVQGLGLKWPNDVVEHVEAGRGRKLAGVLIEVSGGLAVVGIGLNVGQADGDWPAELRDAAVSLRQKGVVVGRPEVAEAVLEGVSRWLGAPADGVRQRWMEIGTLLGRDCVFSVEGRLVSGVVVDLDAQWRLVLEQPAGGRIRLDSAHAHFEESGCLGS